MAYGIALAAALSVEDPFMQTDNLQVSLTFMPLGVKQTCMCQCMCSMGSCPGMPCMQQTGVCFHLAEHVNTAASRGAR